MIQIWIQYDYKFRINSYYKKFILPKIIADLVTNWIICIEN